MDLNTGVFERSGSDTIGQRAFYLIIGLVTVWGLGGTALVASLVAKSGFEPGWISIVLLGLVVPMIGIFISAGSENCIVSFIGLNMVSIPFGVILAPIVNNYSPGLIQNVFLATACITGVMIFLAMIRPKLFSGLGGVLFSALLGLLIVRVLQMFIPALAVMNLFDWIGVVIFTLYIGYDWYRASEVPRTLDNAVDVALDLYLDIVNLFVHLLAASSDD